MRHLSIAAFSVAVFNAIAASAACANPTISLARDEQDRRVFELRGIDGDEAASPGDFGRDFLVYAVLDAAPVGQPPLAGRYSSAAGAIRFTPRFPLQPGMRYKAVYRGAAGIGAEPVLTQEFSIAALSAAPATRVAAVYPTAAALPENQLKFYLHFTGPMGRGEAYDHLSLLDAAGQNLDLPFLELGEELWNPSGDRLTLLLDPARVKQGLKPREEAGPVLLAGRSYTLVVGRKWRDAVGQPLAAEFRKAFRVIAADETCPSPKKWRLTVPRAGAAAPVVVSFGEPLDHALLERMLWVADGRGQRLPGEQTIGDDQSSWSFRPRRSWQAGRYRLVADPLLEDLAGNSIARRFEFDAARSAPAGRDHAAQDAIGVIKFEVAD